MNDPFYHYEDEPIDLTLGQKIPHITLTVLGFSCAFVIVLVASLALVSCGY